MSDNATHPIEGPNGPIPAEDYFNSPEYQAFVESMVPHCRCEFDQPCDGVLSGGLCDERKEERDDDEPDYSAEKPLTPLENYQRNDEHRQP